MFSFAEPADAGRFAAGDMNARLAILGEFLPGFEPHAATNPANERSLSKLGFQIQAEWIATTMAVEKFLTAEFDTPVGVC